MRADLVFGASAHVPQAVEVYNGTPIFYGLGNFAFDWWFLEDYRDGLLVECDVIDGRVSKVGFRPVSRTRDPSNRVELLLADDPRATEIVTEVAELSSEFGTTFMPAGDSIVVYDVADQLR